GEGGEARLALRPVAAQQVVDLGLRRGSLEHEADGDVRAVVGHVDRDRLVADLEQLGQRRLTAGSQLLVLLPRELVGAEGVEERRVRNRIECHAAACPLMQAKTVTWRLLPSNVEDVGEVWR